MTDPINPSHYKSGDAQSGLEVFDVIEQFCADNAHRSHAVKYLLRAGKKAGTTATEDLEKAIRWTQREIDYLKHLELQRASTGKAPGATATGGRHIVAHIQTPAS